MESGKELRKLASEALKKALTCRAGHDGSSWGSTASRSTLTCIRKKRSGLKLCLHGLKLTECAHDREAAMLSSHPICTRRRWRVRHLKPKTHRLEQWKSFSHYKMSLSHHPNHIMAESNHQWTQRHIIPQLHRTLEPQSTAGQTGIFISDLKFVCISTHRVGVIGIGPWPASSWTPGERDH